MTALIYLALLVVAFFFLIVLPQRRQLAARRALIGSLEVGDEIVTTGGIHGTIRTLADDTLRLEIADGIVVTLARAAVGQRLGGPGDEVDGAERADEEIADELDDELDLAAADTDTAAGSEVDGEERRGRRRR